MDHTCVIRASLIPPRAISELEATGAAWLIDDATVDVGLGSGVIRTTIIERQEAGVEVACDLARHEVDFALLALEVELRELVGTRSSLRGWRTKVSLGGAEVKPAPANPPPEWSSADEEAFRSDQGTRLRRRAASFRAVPLKDLPTEVTDKTASIVGADTEPAELLAGCLMDAADLVVEDLFGDIVLMTRAAAEQRSVPVSELQSIGQLPSGFASQYDLLFARRLLVVMIDMTGRLTNGWRPLTCVAQALAVDLWLTQVVAVSDTIRVPLVRGWRDAVESLLFDDLGHKLLYGGTPAGLASAGRGRDGPLPSEFNDWFKPLTEESLPPYATP